MMRGAAVRFGNRFFSVGFCVCGARAALNWFQNVNRWSESTRAPSPQVALYLFFSWTPASHFTQISCLEGRPARKKEKRDEVVHDLRDETFTLCFFYFSNLLFFKLKAPNLLYQILFCFVFFQFSRDAKRSSTRWPFRWWTSGRAWNCAWRKAGTRKACTRPTLCTTRDEAWTSRRRIATAPSTACWPVWLSRPDSTGSTTSRGLTFTLQSNQVRPKSNHHPGINQKGNKQKRKKKIRGSRKRTTEREKQFNQKSSNRTNRIRLDG